MFNKNQKKALEKFKRLKVGALFMKMGTGKTRIAIELVDYNKCDLLIYVAPFSTLKNIKCEFKKWGLNTPYILVGYETISSSDNKYVEILDKIEDKKCFIIADESVFIKSEETKRFQRLCNIREKCDYALVLNGTPITKNEWDLYNQMYFLSPKIIDMSREEFLNTFFKHIKYKRYREQPHDFYKFSEVNAEYLYKLIAPYIFECDLNFELKEEKKYNYIEYDDKEYYEEKEKKLNDYIENGNSNTIINMLQKLNVISSNYSKKNDAIIDYIRDKQIIVFCNYLAEVRYISPRVDCFVITGNTKNRDNIINLFKISKKPLIMTMGTGSFSLNLQFCSEIVYSSLTFDFAKVEQSMYRIKRIGQKNDIKYTFFLSNLGINKFILQNLDRKISLNDLVKEKMMKGDLEWLKDI